MASLALAIALSLAAQLAAPAGDAVSVGVPTNAPAEQPKAPEFPRVITGRVTIGQGHPLPGVLVEWGHFADEFGQRQSVETDEDGRYRLEIVRVGRDFRLGFSLPGFSPVWHDRVIPGPASNPTEIDVQLDRGTEITLLFTNQAGEPIPGLQVTPMALPNHDESRFSRNGPATLFPGRERTVMTDVQGRVVFADLPPLPLMGATERERQRQRSQTWIHLSVTRDGVTADPNVAESQILRGQPVVISFSNTFAPPAERPAGVLRARVLDVTTKKPIPAFQVVQRNEPLAHAIRDVEGEFTLDDAGEPGNTYEVRIFAPGYAVGVAKIVAAADRDAQPMTIELTPHPSLEGRLVDAAGQPLAKAPIVAGFAPQRVVEWDKVDRYADGRYSRDEPHYLLENVLHVTTDEAGRFTIPEEPGAPSTLVVAATGHAFRVIPPEQRPMPDANGVVSFALQPAASVTAIALRDTPLGATADAVTLEYVSNDGFEHRRPSLKFDEANRVSIDGLAPGDYRLVLSLDASDATFPSYSKRFTLATGEHKEVPLGDMPGALRLSGNIGPFNVITVHANFLADHRHFAVTADIDGRFQLDGLLPGEYIVKVDRNSALDDHRLEEGERSIQLTESMELDRY
jgi:hypothetical protein